MKKKISSESTDLGFQIAPMIDVVFVIMLFFMVMASAVKTEKQLTTKPPSHGDSLVNGPCDETIISISEDGYISVNEEELGLPGDTKLKALTDLLGKLRTYNTSSGTQTLVTIQTENETRYQRIIEVLNAVNKAQIKNVTFGIGEES
jgi:biopolymer transport protein ExbD